MAHRSIAVLRENTSWQYIADGYCDFILCRGCGEGKVGEGRFGGDGVPEYSVLVLFDDDRFTLLLDDDGVRGRDENRFRFVVILFLRLLGGGLGVLPDDVRGGERDREFARGVKCDACACGSGEGVRSRLTFTQWSLSSSPPASSPPLRLVNRGGGSMTVTPETSLSSTIPLSTPPFLAEAGPPCFVGSSDNSFDTTG